MNTNTLSRENASKQGWYVERTTCSSYDSYNENCFVLYQPNGEPFDGAGADYGYDWGDDTEEAAWARLENREQ